MQMDSSQKSLKMLPRGAAASALSTYSIVSRKDGKRDKFAKGVGLSFHQK